MFLPRQESTNSFVEVLEIFTKLLGDFRVEVPDDFLKRLNQRLGIVSRHLLHEFSLDLTELIQSVVGVLPSELDL